MQIDDNFDEAILLVKAYTEDELAWLTGEQKPQPVLNIDELSEEELEELTAPGIQEKKKPPVQKKMEKEELEALRNMLGEEFEEEKEIDEYEAMAAGLENKDEYDEIVSGLAGKSETEAESEDEYSQMAEELEQDKEEENVAVNSLIESLFEPIERDYDILPFENPEEPGAEKDITEPIIEEIKPGPDVEAAAESSTSKDVSKYGISSTDLAAQIMEENDSDVIDALNLLQRPYLQANERGLEWAASLIVNPSSEKEVEFAAAHATDSVKNALLFLKKKIVMAFKLEHYAKGEEPEMIDMLAKLIQDRPETSKQTFLSEVMQKMLISSTKARKENLKDQVIKEKQEKAINIPEGAQAAIIGNIAGVIKNETYSSDSEEGQLLNHLFHELSKPQNKNKTIEIANSDGTKIKVKEGPQGKGDAARSIYIDSTTIDQFLSPAAEHLNKNIFGNKVLIEKNPDGSFTKDIKKTYEYMQKEIKKPEILNVFKKIYTSAAFDKALKIIRGENV